MFGKEEGFQNWWWERVGELLDHDFCLCYNKDILISAVYTLQTPLFHQLLLFSFRFL